MHKVNYIIVFFSWLFILAPPSPPQGKMKYQNAIQSERRPVYYKHRGGFRGGHGEAGAHLIFQTPRRDEAGVPPPPPW